MTQKYRGFSLSQIAAHIDHSVLKPDATSAQVLIAAKFAAQNRVASLCIRPMDVRAAVSQLQGSGVPVCTVIGFPHGTTTTAAKVAETVEAVANGCLEVDMVLNVSQLIDQNFDAVLADISAVTSAAKTVNQDCIVKVIFETAFLTQALIAKACELTERAGADFVKTSTGFASAGATVENVALMKRCVGDRLKVKASGGVRTLDQVIDFIEAGASRCGASATDEILKEFASKAPLD